MNGRTEKKKMEWIRKIQGGFCLFFIVFGMSLCMESVLSLWMPWQMRLAMAAAVTAFAELCSFGVWWALSGVLVFAGVLSMAVIRYQQMFEAGFLQFWNRVLEMVNSYYRTEYLLYYVEEKENYAFLLILLIAAVLGLLEGLVILAGHGRKRRFFAAAVLPALVVAAGLMAGLAPSAVGIMLMFIGLAVWLCDFREQGRWLVCGVLAVSIWLPALLVSDDGLWEHVGVLNEEWQERQLALEDRMLLEMNRIMDMPAFSQREMKQYSLNNDRPEFTGREVLRITVDKRPLSPVYLRGFVGGDYADGTWKRVSRQEFSDWAQSLGGDEQSYARIIQNYPYDVSVWAAKDTFTAYGFEKQVTIQLKQPVKRYTLTPYFSKIPEGQPLKADGIFPAGKSVLFTWDSFLNLGEYALAATEYMYPDAWDTFFHEGNFARNLEIWNQYRDYANKTYQRLPEEGLEGMRAYVKEHKEEFTTYEEAFEKIQEKLSVKSNWEMSEMMEVLTEEELSIMNGNVGQNEYNVRRVLELLWRDNRYSFDLDGTPPGEDIVEDFLLRRHKGYCTHFASAATLLFRLNGMPARYASGYLVLTSDFQENEDGTWTAVVTDERAHAWTEIFYDNLGFCPTEATPPAYRELLEGMEGDESLGEAIGKSDREYELQHPEQTEKPSPDHDAQNTPSGNKNLPSGAGSKGGRTGNQGFFYQYRRFCLSAGGTVFAAAGLYLFLYIRRRRALRERQRRFGQENRARAVCEMGKELGRIFGLLGIRRPRGMHDREFQQVLEREVPEIVWEPYFSILRKARYSAQEVTEEEYGRMMELYRKMEQRLTGKGKIRDWYIRYVKIYT